jgi:uncharacterized iron-regulated membrane protein
MSLGVAAVSTLVDPESDLGSDHPTSAVTTSPKLWPDYRAVWRWHFYAGVWCAPFVAFLSLTGMIYLFKTEVEAWIDRPLDQRVVSGPPAPAVQHVTAAVAAVPDATFQAYELPQQPQSAIRVLVRAQGETYRVAIDPASAEVLQTVKENDRLMRQIFRLHGELMMGDWGSHLVELAACWTIILVLTGLTLWWPKSSHGWGGVLYPRLQHGGRLFWRDLHSVTGVWISVGTVLLLLSGLPWAKFWGDYFRTVRQATGLVSRSQDWSNTSEATPRPPKGETGPTMTPPSTAASTSSGHEGHGSGRRSQPSAPLSAQHLATLDRVVAVATPLGLLPPVLLSAEPKQPGVWSVKSMTANRPWRETLTVDGRTGEILHREGFSDKHWIDQVVAVGIALHEGRLFGWPNQLLGLLTALGLMLLCYTGLLLWWRRRDAGVLGAPDRAAPPRFSAMLLGLVMVLAVCLPLFGASLLVVLLLDRWIFPQVPPLQRWLGLSRTVAAVR